jgi:dihydroorotase-like cyclic amidohydrolase
MAVKRFPGFIDVHVHLREPGATQKEDFLTGSRAAVKGGFTFVVDMPNNAEPTISIERLDEKAELSKKAICDIGFHYGTNGKNTETFKDAAARPEVYGLKLYCNHTTGEMLVEDLSLLEGVYAAWPSEKPILVHAEGVQLAGAIGLAALYGKRLHVCHITQKVEVELVREAKKRKHQVTAGVCPHHLYLTGEARESMGAFALMKPPLGTKEDMEALWKGLADETIDIVETDHAPHTRAEKESEKPPFGVPGLETAAGLLFKAVADKRVTEARLITALHEYPKKIFNIPDQPDTYTEIDTEKVWTVGENGYESKADWSPFAGWKLPGSIEKVVVRGKTLLDGGRIL